MNLKSPHMLSRQSGKAWLLVIVGVAALAAGVWLSESFSGKENAGTSASDTVTARERAKNLIALQDSLITSLALPLDFKSIGTFELIDTNAQPITEAIFNDKWSLVFFGYTHCPDVCPITLQVMKDVVARLEEQNEPVPQIVFVSVDPVRDTSAVMKQYVSHFNDRFIGITGDVNKVHALTSSLGIVASFTANDTNPDNYIVDHTASLLLVDPQRRVRAKVSPPLQADAVIADYLQLVAAPS
jgi:protein SCO1/2